MKRLEEVIKIKLIQLENVKIDFKYKLIQWQLNNIIYKYKNKYAFNEYINCFINELTEIIKQNNIQEEEQGQELLNKTRQVVKNCKDYQKTTSVTLQDFTETIDKALRYILFQYSKNKQEIKLYEQIELLQELKLLKGIIEANNITQTDRIKNCYKLLEQLKESIIKQL